MKAKMLAIGMAALTVALMAGCTSGSGGNSDVSRIKGRYREMQKGFEQKDIQRVMSIWSYDFLDNGVTFDDVKNGVADLFLDFNNITEEQRFHDITVQGNYAYVSWTETLTGIDAQTGDVKRSVTRFDDVMHWEYGDWFLYGNQNSSVVAQKAVRYNGQRLRMAPVKPR